MRRNAGLGARAQTALPRLAAGAVRRGWLAGAVLVACSGVWLIAGVSVAQAASYGTPVTIASGFNQPQGVAVDAQGDLFVADTNNNQVVEEKPQSGGGYSPKTIGSGFSMCGGPSQGEYDLADGVGVDGSGNVFVAIQSPCSAVLELTPDGSGGYTQNQNPIGAANLFTPWGVAVDRQGNLFVPDDGETFEFAPDGNGGYAQKTFGTWLSSDGCCEIWPRGAAVDAQGDVFVTAYGGLTSTSLGLVVEEKPDGSGGYDQTIPIDSGLTYPTGVAVDAEGDLFIADTNDNRVVEETPNGDGYTETTIASGFNSPAGVAVDGRGDLFVADTGNNQVVEIPAAQPTTTTLSSSANPSLLNQPVTLTATVSGPAGSTQVPGGTVTFADGSTTLGTGTLDGSGTATYTTSALAAGSHQITASYGGDSNDQASQSTALTQTVNSDTPSGAVALTGRYVESSAAFKALSPQMQQAITTAVNDATQWLTKISPTLNATQKARLIAGYDQAIGYLQSKGYLTADQATTLKAVAGGV